MKRSKQTKKALTSSVLALVLCFVMLLGTTFAWFTDTASTGVSKIQAGELKIALEKKVSKGNEISWESIKDDEVLNFLVADEDGNLSEGEDILWEPGCTYQLPTLKVVNKGDLALEYMVVVTAVVGDVNLAEVLDVYYTGNLSVKENGTTTTSQVTKQNIGTLNEILTSEDEDGFAHGVLKAGEDSGEITIALHMKESAGNQYQDKSITGIKVAVYAKQYTYEYDSNGNDYDAQAEYDMAGLLWDGTAAPLTRGNDTPDNVTTLADVTDDEEKTVKISTPELLAAFAQSVNEGNNYFKYKVYLEADMNLGDKEWTPIGTSSNPFQGNFYGQDYTISNLKITSGKNVGLFGHITLAGNVKDKTSTAMNYTPGIENLTLHNVAIKADNSGAFVGNANTTTQNAGNGGALILTNLQLTGDVKIEGANAGGIIGTEWTDFQIAATNITVQVNAGSYVKGTGVIGGVFASTPHGTVENITSNINVYVTGVLDSKSNTYVACAGGIVGCAGWTLKNVTCTGNVTATNISATDNGKYMVGKIVGKEANNSYWNRYKSGYKSGSTFVDFTANNTLSITLTDNTTLTSNGLGDADKKGSQNQVDYTQSLVGAPIWDWKW